MVAISTNINALLADQMFAIYSHAETLMLEKVKRRVERGILDEGWTERKAKEIVAVREELKKLVDDTTKLASKEVTKAIKTAYESGVKSANKDFKLPETIITDYQIPASVQRLVLETNQMIVGTSVSILREATDVFRQIQAEVSVGVLSGVETRRQIAQRMLNKFADNGVTSFVDKAGRKWEMATYTEMATRTVTARAAIQGHLDRQAEYGRDLIIVSDHAGECPVCRPWENKVLSISGKSIEYPSLATATSAGLFHPNCRHTITGYIPGLTKIEPPPNGGVPEQYDYTQRQRHYERQIRRWKRREVVAMDAKETMLARSKIKEFQLRQRQMLKEYEEKFGMTLRRKYDRESISNRTGLAGIDKSPRWAVIQPRPVKKPRKPRNTFKPENYAPLSGELGSQYASMHYDYFSKIDEMERNAVTKYTSSYYSYMNTYLRTGKADTEIDRLKGYIDRTSKALKGAPALMENTIMFRAVQMDSVDKIFGSIPELKMYMDGALNNYDGALEKVQGMLYKAELLDPAFLSSSWEGTKFSGSVVFEFFLPKGYKKGAFVEKISEFKSEREYLIDKGQKFEIFDIQKEGSKIKIKVKPK